MPGHDFTNSKAFGIEAGHTPFRLRQSRYFELGLECAALASRHFSEMGCNLELLDVGVYDGITRKYTEANPGGASINYHGVDLFPHGESFVYKHDEWVLHRMDLEHGLPGLDAARFDLVVCEQVLEHLHNPAVALSEMARVLRPGGHMVLGIPIFPDGLHLIRKHVIPLTDVIFRVKKKRGHVQAWSLRSFLRLVQRTCPGLVLKKKRGFRIVSGGILRPLEYHRPWWQLNRLIGRLLPSLCIEAQVLYRKSSPPENANGAGKICPGPVSAK